MSRGVQVWVGIAEGIDREEVIVHLTPTDEGDAWLVRWPVQAALGGPGSVEIVRKTIETSSAFVAAATALQARVRYLGWSRDLVALKRVDSPPI